MTVPQLYLQLNQGHNNATPTASEIESSLTLDILKKHRLIGAGSFGKVYLTEDVRVGQAYALKVFEKCDCTPKNALREKEIMLSLKSEFVVALKNTFQDDFHLYMVMTFYPGGELLSLIHNGIPGRRRRYNDTTMPECDARFYSAGILEGLKHLHEMKIAYRDLKPDNILLGADGYTVIADMGTAKVVIDKSFTICGTHYYIAPEVIMGKGHDHSADIWSFAILLYEMILGYTPFNCNEFCQMTLFKKINKVQYNFPEDAAKMSPEAKDLIGKILIKQPLDRLGARRNIYDCNGDSSNTDGIDDLRHHAWYYGNDGDWDWDAFRRKDIPAPWVPDVRHSLDSRYFENDWDYLDKDTDVNVIRISEEKQALFKNFDC